MTIALKCECGSCPVCRSRERQRAYRADPEAVNRLRANDRRRYYRNRQKRRAAMDAYAKTDQGRARNNAAKRAYAERNPEKRAATVAVNNAVRDGRLLKQPCERAGADCGGRIEAHHDDYSKPLIVRWLCRDHHEAHHELVAPAPRAEREGS